MYAKEYSDAGVKARWLEPLKAQHAYDYALKYSHPKRYGLNKESVANIDRLIIESYSVAKAWLAKRIPSTGTVQIVYSESEVAVVEAAEFVERWHEIFLPARDDAVVLHNLSSTVLFYCHEEELEVGQRKDLIDGTVEPLI
ncbi:hypothetical protein [Pseudomonas sp. SO81]|uniref:hypothetical protein n=1 Tax=Pseudomonas sp. SO81 TaxID=2983246 RepID=UPI0025A49771|nr:hypothetical protein [Pseudomonas sp. SO81]WJN60813.1 hypothetical protein OH686_18865 [Pseudomonas sp. SO81]